MGQNSGGLLPEKATEDTIKGRSVERRRGTKIQVTWVFKAETEKLSNCLHQKSTWVYFQEHFAKFCLVLSLFYFQKYILLFLDCWLGMPEYKVWGQRWAGKLVLCKKQNIQNEKTSIYRISQFICGKFFHHGWFPSTIVMSLNVKFGREAQNWL